MLVVLWLKPGLHIQSQKTQGFRVADFLRRYLTKEDRVRNFFYCLMWIKEPCVRKFERLARSKILGISQTNISCKDHERMFANTFLSCPGMALVPV